MKRILNINNNLSDKLVKGLSNLGLNEGDMLDYHYTQNLKLPNKSFCICGSFMTINYYLINDKSNDTLIICSNCIKSFKKTCITSKCEICQHEHKNKKVNRCNSCRKGKCDKCNNNCDINYSLCFDCKNGYTNKKLPSDSHVCSHCKEILKTSYEICKCSKNIVVEDNLEVNKCIVCDIKIGHNKNKCYNCSLLVTSKCVSCFRRVDIGVSHCFICKKRYW